MIARFAPARHLPLLVALTLAGCGQPRQLSVDHAYVRLPTVSGNPAAAYFTVHGGKADAQLIDVTTPVAIQTMVHETVDEGGVSVMRPVARVAVPAGATVLFAPGGRHAMIMGLEQRVAKGSTMPLVVTFASGERIKVDAAVIGAGDPPPK